MRRLVLAAFLAVLSLTVLAAADRAEAGVMVQIDRASQTMEVSVDGGHLYTWKVSTARPGYRTPTGVFHPQMDGRALVLTQLLQLADAACDLLPWRLRHSRQLRDCTARRSGVAWLRAAASRTTRRSCSAWWSGKACATPPSWCSSACSYTSTFSAAMKASCGMSTLPNWRMRFLPFFCLSRSLRLRVTSPP